MFYSLKQEMKATDDNARIVKDITVQVNVVQHGMNEEKLERVFSNVSMEFTEFLLGECKKGKETREEWRELEDLFQ